MKQEIDRNKGTFFIFKLVTVLFLLLIFALVSLTYSGRAADKEFSGSETVWLSALWIGYFLSAISLIFFTFLYRKVLFVFFARVHSFLGFSNAIFIAFLGTPLTINFILYDFLQSFGFDLEPLVNAFAIPIVIVFFHLIVALMLNFIARVEEKVELQHPKP